MKNVTLILAAFTLSIAFVSCQKENIEPQKSFSDENVIKTTPASSLVYNGGSLSNQTFNVRYEVNIHLALEKRLCNVYQVEILDGTGHQVMPAKIYVPGTTVYTFYEQTRLSTGIRIARLVLVPFEQHFVCQTELYTQPMLRTITFQEGSAYPFDLYPSTHQTKI